MIANAAVDIWMATGVSPVLKYKDDLKAFALAVPDGPFKNADFSYNYDKNDAMQRIAPLHVPWHEQKGNDEFLPVTDFIGYTWDLPRKRVSLPDAKRLKFYHRVRTFIENFSGHKCHMLDVQKIHGSLCHVAFVYPEGRSRLPSLSNFTSKFRNSKFARRYPPRQVLRDLAWWEDLLHREGRYRQLAPRGELQDLGIYVDASTSWGIGITIGQEWAAFRLAPDWKEDGIDICWLEVLALEFLFYILVERGLGCCHVLVRSDNQGAIGAIGKGRSLNDASNVAVRRIHATIIPAFITPSLVYMNTALNLADPISRGLLGKPDHHIQHRFSLPEELRPKFR